MFALSRFVNGNKTTNAHAFECSDTVYVVDVAVINRNMALSCQTAQQCARHISHLMFYGIILLLLNARALDQSVLM